MKKTIVFVLACFWHVDVSAQSPVSFETFYLEPNNKDTGSFFIDLSVATKLVFEKPTTLYKTNQFGQQVVEEEPRRIRYQPRMRWSYMLFPKQDLSDRYHLHGVFEAEFLMTYLSAKLGVGLADRHDKNSFGAFAGIYMRRVDVVTELKLRSGFFEEAALYGAYYHSDGEHAAFFASYALERHGNYRRIHLCWKAGETICRKVVPRGLRIHIESESFLGTGFGISYRRPKGNIHTSCSYLVPEIKEKREQRAFGNFLGEGMKVEFSYIFH